MGSARFVKMTSDSMGLALDLDKGDLHWWFYNMSQLLRILGQLLRLLFTMPDFVSLSSGLVTNFRRVAVTMLMLCSFLFMFAIVFIKLQTPNTDGCYETVLYSM